jgi:LGFP repeat
MATLINFEDLAPGTTVTTQFGPRGVLFNNNFLDTDPAAHSGTHVLRTVAPTAEVFDPIPLVMTFTSRQARVRLFASSAGTALNGTLTAFDEAGNVVARDGPRLVAANVFTTMFEVIDHATTARIARAELRLDTGIHFAIDDLEFEGQPVIPPPNPPTVHINAPINGSQLDVASIDIGGTVTGQGLVSPVKLTVTFGRPPESTAPPFTSDLALLGTGTTRQFSLPGFAAPLGPIQVTVTAQNSAAKSGTASVTVTNLPTAIRNRFVSEGGAASLGAFHFGLFAGACKIAVYQSGAISVDGAGATHVIRGQIFAKWLALRSLSEVFGIGCPLGEERDGPPGSRAQDFEHGRIYSHPTIGTFSVPAVFVDAIDKRGGENATGIPIAEPTSSSGVMQTWLFQRFARPDRHDLLPSTLEIRGTPPTLWMERQSGNMSYPVEFSATLWETFSCAGSLGPCSVDPTPDPPPKITDAGRFCDLTRYPIFPREWRPILSDFISTPVFGVAVYSHLAGVDNPLTHEIIYECAEQIDCPSDWNVDIFPIGHPPGDIGPFTSLLASNSYVTLEYEDGLAQHPHVMMDWPQIGDLFFAAGRWIVDCGHTNYHTELHPPFMYAKMKSEDFQGHLATRADVWVNGWYPGDPIVFDIFPPPRPTPDSTLVVNKPVDSDAALDVNVSFRILPASAPNHVQVTFTASRREVPVTDAGEMMMQPGRAYEGQWFVYWTP